MSFERSEDPRVYGEELIKKLFAQFRFVGFQHGELGFSLGEGGVDFFPSSTAEGILEGQAQ